MVILSFQDNNVMKDGLPCVDVVNFPAYKWDVDSSQSSYDFICGVLGRNTREYGFLVEMEVSEVLYEVSKDCIISVWKCEGEVWKRLFREPEQMSILPGDTFKVR